MCLGPDPVHTHRQRHTLLNAWLRYANVGQNEQKGLQVQRPVKTALYSGGKRRYAVRKEIAETFCLRAQHCQMISD
jgi:hypothetical protein